MWKGILAVVGGIAVGGCCILSAIFFPAFKRAMEERRDSRHAAEIAAGTSAIVDPARAPTAPAPPPRPPALPVRPGELMADYRANEVGADNKYRGKRLSILAMVESAQKDALDHIVVNLEAGAIDGRGGMFHLKDDTLLARFDDEWSGSVGALRRGDVIAVTCTGAGLHMQVPVLTDCAIDWSQPVPLGSFPRQLGRSYELCIVEKATPLMNEALDAGQLPDGGRLTDDARAFVKIAPKLEREDSADLEAAHLEPLGCEHPALRLIGRCEGLGETAGPKECSSVLRKEAWRFVHR